MGGRPIVSVVIPAFHRTEMLKRAVLSVFAQDFPKDQYEVIVVDSSRDDRNEKMLAELAAEATCPYRFFRKKSEGPGPSRNLGATQSTSEFIAFMDSDCFAEPGWLKGGVAGFRDGVGIVQGRTLPNPTQKPTGFTYYIRVEQETWGYETANIFYRRTAFEETRGFPADAHSTRDKHLGGEDAELAWEVKRNGWQTRFAETALVYHEVFTVSPISWVFVKHHFIFPRLVRMFPELRQFMCAKYFHDLGQALFALALVGAVGSLFTLWSLVLVLPYVAHRAGGPAGTLRGPLRPLRVLMYLPRDFCSFGILLAASIRYRCLLL
jgi:glycosyltransferase involved in cell wall biosynthesis